MDRPPANDSQRSEQIVVLARIRTRDSTIIHTLGLGLTHALYALHASRHGQGRGDARTFRYFRLTLSRLDQRRSTFIEEQLYSFALSVIYY